MQKETLKRYHTLTLFDCGKRIMEKEGRFPLTNKWGRAVNITLRDTVVHPDGWAGTKLSLEYTDFGDDTSVIFAFGKPFANDNPDTAKHTLTITKGSIKLGDTEYNQKTNTSGCIDIEISETQLCVYGNKFAVNAAELSGYLDISATGGSAVMTGFSVQTPTKPYTEEEHTKKLIAWRHAQLDKADECIDKLETYIKENPSVLPKRGGELIVPLRLADLGDTTTIRVISYGTRNAALSITKNCYGNDSKPEQIELLWKQDGENYYADIDITLDVAGNTKIEYWANLEKIVRQIAVLDKGYMAVIPWIGSNKPFVDEEIHRFDLPGDYWFYAPRITEPEDAIEKYLPFIRNSRKYGDRTVPFVNAGQIIPQAETDTLFELDKTSQERGFAQIKRQMQIMGYDEMELVASYTPDAVTIGILNRLSVKGLTSLCAWQNWHDGGWEINHCGVSNQPYYPADDNFRRSDVNKKGLMCFTMGNSSCNRNYSIMALDSCPSNAVPGERYLNNYVVNQGVERFFDAFDGYIADSKNNDSLMTVTVAIESFSGRMDWNAANEAAIRHMVKRASTEKIVFTSAADVSDYHKRKNLKMQEAYFFQPDYYYGYGNGTMPGRIDDRLEAITNDYLAVIRRSSMLPMYFYDYTMEWASKEEEPERNEFGQVDPDEHKASECVPRQVYREDMTITSEMSGNTIRIYATTPIPKRKMVTGVFDVLFEADFTATIDKPDATLKKITDNWTGNTHLFIDMGALDAGETVLEIEISGTPRTPVDAEFIKDGFAAMWFGEHAYLRSCDRDGAVKVTMPAPDSAYLKLISGKKVCAKDGELNFTVNTAWFDESPTLYGFPKAEFEKALERAKVEYAGKTTCSRWSGQ
ncbi:MAG: hypothetical protein IJC09_05295 [Clostridia bacterium]|nr:hypothetical protein [Clostridia bacterium]